MVLVVLVVLNRRSSGGRQPFGGGVGRRARAADDESVGPVGGARIGAMTRRRWVRFVANSSADRDRVRLLLANAAGC